MGKGNAVSYKTQEILNSLKQLESVLIPKEQIYTSKEVHQLYSVRVGVDLKDYLTMNIYGDEKHKDVVMSTFVGSIEEISIDMNLKTVVAYYSIGGQTFRKSFERKFIFQKIFIEEDIDFIKMDNVLYFFGENIDTRMRIFNPIIDKKVVSIETFEV